MTSRRSEKFVVRIWSIKADGNPSSGYDFVGFRVASIPEPSTLLGDMNGDFNVTLADVSLLIEALVNRTAYEAHMISVNPDINGDVNQDGTFGLLFRVVELGEWAGL